MTPPSSSFAPMTRHSCLPSSIWFSSTGRLGGPAGVTRSDHDGRAGSSSSDRTRTWRHTRTLVLPAQKGARRGEPSGIPVMGRIAAGTPITAVENQEDTLPLRPDWLPTGGSDVFALRVQGDSMIDAHIMSGDLVVVRKQETAGSGDIVAALLDGEATVKRFAREGGTVVLRPEHPTMKPIVVEPGRGDFRILGKVVGVVRQM